MASALVNTTQQVGGSLGTALLNTVAATVTANYIAANGLARAPAGVVHGFSVAFALGAVMLGLGALVSAVCVTARSRDLSPGVGRAGAGHRRGPVERSEPAQAPDGRPARPYPGTMAHPRPSPKVRRPEAAGNEACGVCRGIGACRVGGGAPGGSFDLPETSTEDLTLL